MHFDASQLLETFFMGGGAWWVFSTAVRTMPVPADSERWYGWLYRFCQGIAANHDLNKK